MTSGVIRWTVSDLHPHALTLDEGPLVAGLITAQDLRDNIAALSTPPVILHLRCVAPADVGGDVLVAAGFVQVGLTKLFKVALPVADSVPPDGLTLDWHRPSAIADWAEWYQAHWDHYRRTHPAHLAKDPGAHRYSEIFGGNDLIEALFVYQDDRLVGFGSLRKDHEMGWIDVTGAQTSAQTLAAILSAVWRRATAHGWPFAELEVDDDHPALWSLTECFADQPQDTFVMWQRAKA